MTAIADAARILGSLAVRNVEFGSRTTYRVGGTASLGVQVDDERDLAVVARAVIQSGVEVIVFGRGSNILVADAGFEGLLVTLGSWAERIVIDGTTVVAGSAVALPQLARRTVAEGLAGLEWAVGVPGSVGGGVFMNAGGHGSDMASTLRGVRVFSLASGNDVQVPAADLGLAFRHSELTERDVVLDATFDLTVGSRQAGETLIDEIVHWRRAHQPGGQNAGSVFVNPLPRSAGELIDHAGCRGLRLGSAEVSTKHANFIQADPGGSADDVHAVMQKVRDTVAERFGVELRSEIRLVGFEGSR